MPVVWDAETILRFANRGEDYFATEYPCIIDRISLDIVSGTNQYTLPDYVIDIRRVLWQGHRLDPISLRNFKDSFPTVLRTGKPREYIYSNVGKQVIQFVPIPDVNITSVLTGLYGTEIPNRVIVEFWRTPDHETFKIPDYIRRRLLKCYVAKMCFAMEGKGQNLKASKYFDAKWKFLNEFYSGLLSDLVSKPRRLVVGKDLHSVGESNASFAHLNQDKFGISVDNEY